MARVLYFILTTACFLFSYTALAGVETSVVGDWLTVDKKTGKPSSVIRIWQQNDQYLGKIDKILSNSEQGKKELCTRCIGDRYNKPILGLTIIRDLRARRGDYVDGHILDPRTGKEYQCVLQLADGGSKLNVHAYIGAPIFGRTEVWTRY